MTASQLPLALPSGLPAVHASMKISRASALDKLDALIADHDDERIAMVAPGRMRLHQSVADDRVRRQHDFGNGIILAATSVLAMVGTAMLFTLGTGLVTPVLGKELFSSPLLSLPLAGILGGCSVFAAYLAWRTVSWHVTFGHGAQFLLEAREAASEVLCLGRKGIYRASMDSGQPDISFYPFSVLKTLFVADERDDGIEHAELLAVSGDGKIIFAAEGFDRMAAETFANHFTDARFRATRQQRTE